MSHPYDNETDNLMSSYDDDLGSNVCDADSVANG